MALKLKKNKLNQEDSKLREKEKAEKKVGKSSNPKIRLIPIWLRLLIVLLLLFLSLFIGLLIGYGVIGEGDAIDVMKPSTWKHLINIVRKE